MKNGNRIKFQGNKRSNIDRVSFNNGKKKHVYSKFFKRFVSLIDRNRQRLWILLVGLYVIPYTLVVICSVLFPSNNIFLIMAMIATSEGVGTFSYMIKKWGCRPKSRIRKVRKNLQKINTTNNFDTLSRYIT